MFDLNKNHEFIFALGFLVFYSVTIVTKRHVNKLHGLFTNKLWLMNLTIIFAWCVYVYRVKKDEKLKDATEKAIIGFTIALFAYFDITIAPFWFIFLFAYYTHNLI